MCTSVLWRYYLKDRISVLNRFSIVSLGALLDRITHGHTDATVRQLAAELGLIARPDTADEYAWNGYPVSFQILHDSESAEPSSVIVDIWIGAAGKLLIRKPSWLTMMLRRWRGTNGGSIAPGLEVVSEPVELGQRLL